MSTFYTLYFGHFQPLKVLTICCNDQKQLSINVLDINLFSFVRYLWSRERIVQLSVTHLCRGHGDTGQDNRGVELCSYHPNSHCQNQDRGGSHMSQVKRTSSL